MMTIRPVHEPKDWKLFHDVQREVYRNDPNFIAPLRMEVEQIFNPGKNTAFAHGHAQCFVLLDGKRPVGRIAAFFDEERSRHLKYKTGGIGFFECVQDPAYAKMLFNSAEEYLRTHEVEVIDGPINFGERDKFWGLLVHHFAPPLYQENYNPPYYVDFFTHNGYQPFEQILTYAGKSSNIPVKRLSQIAQRLRSRHPLRVEPFSYQHIDTFARDFSEVYNAAFNVYEHFNPVSPDLIRTMMETAKPILDPNIACIAYFEDQPAGFIALYPDINPLLKGFHGKLNLFTLPKFLWRKRSTASFNAKGMGFGIHPAHQSKGVFALLMEYLCSDRNMKRYPYMYLATIRTHNHEIRSIYDKLGVHVDRVHVAYRKPLKAGIEIEPFEFIKVEDLETKLD